MAQPGFATTVKVSGTAVPVTAEPMTSLGGNVFQITNTARRILDPTAPISVFDGVTLLTTVMGEYPIAVDYLFGKITLGAAAGGAITINASYLPTLPIAEIRKASFKRGRTMLDRTTFDSGGVRQRLSGLLSIEGSLTGLGQLNTDLDAGVGGVQSLQSFFDAGTPKLLEVKPLTGGYFRAWILLEDLGEDIAVDGLLEGTYAFKGTTINGAGFAFLSGAGGGWGT